MDSRHETVVQETLNTLILAINRYLIENTDEVVADERRLQALERLAKRIYQAADSIVDASGLISKHNLLAVHPLLLPLLSEMTHDDETRLESISKALDELSFDPSTALGRDLIPSLKEILSS